jgi:membrane-associated protease RseP (regulator of RpoE activity)
VSIPDLSEGAVDTGPGWPPAPPKPHADAPATGTDRPAGSPAGLVALIAGVILLGLLTRLSLVIVVLAIIVMIFLHELGHYLTAKAAGMKVTEFFIGFGPRIWSFSRGETEYGFKAIPAGAYVRIIGMHNLDEVDPLDESRTYRHKPYWRRLSVAVAGSAMHFLIAIVCLFLLLTVIGIPGGRFVPSDDAVDGLAENPDWVIGRITDGSPADQAGLQDGDRLVSIDGVEVTTFEALRDIVGPRVNQEVEVVAERDGETFSTETTLGEHPDDGPEIGFLGVGPGLPVVTYGVIEGAGRAVSEFGAVTVESVKALGRFFSPSGLADFANQVVDAGEPDEEAGDGGSSGGSGSSEGGSNRVISIYGATVIGADATETGIGGLLSFLVILNVFIGAFNLIPLLPLDGGHVAIATYERIRSGRGQRYHADVAKLLPLTYAVVLLLVMVGLTSLYLDIVSPLSLSE